MPINFIGKIGIFGRHTFICRTGIRRILKYQKPMTIKDENRIECGCIMYKFGEVRCSNSGVLFAYFCTRPKFHDFRSFGILAF